jgi:hypothetical protein
LQDCRICDIKNLEEQIKQITIKLHAKAILSKIIDFENILVEKLKKFNDEYFPVSKFKYKVRQKFIDENSYGAKKKRQFLLIYEKLIANYKIKLLKKNYKTFLEKWYIKNIRNKFDFVFNEIKKVKDENIKKMLTLILKSRAQCVCIEQLCIWT